MNPQREVFRENAVFPNTHPIKPKINITTLNTTAYQNPHNAPDHQCGSQCYYRKDVKEI